jgi:hypothetical protein
MTTVGANCQWAVTLQKPGRGIHRAYARGSFLPVGITCWDCFSRHIVHLGSCSVSSLWWCLWPSKWLLSCLWSSLVSSHVLGDRFDCY